jgi:ribosome-interacting GTPase 1
MRCDATIDELIDVIVGRAHYVKALYVRERTLARPFLAPKTSPRPTVNWLLTLLSLRGAQVYNKIDQLSIEEVDKLARRPHSVVISAGMQLNLTDGLLPAIWGYLDLVRVYTKRRGRTFLPPLATHAAHH